MTWYLNRRSVLQDSAGTAEEAAQSNDRIFAILRAGDHLLVFDS